MCGPTSGPTSVPKSLISELLLGGPCLRPYLRAYQRAYLKTGKPEFQICFVWHAELVTLSGSSPAGLPEHQKS